MGYLPRVAQDHSLGHESQDQEEVLRPVLGRSMIHDRDDSLHLDQILGVEPSSHPQGFFLQDLLSQASHWEQEYFSHSHFSMMIEIAIIRLILSLSSIAIYSQESFSRDLLPSILRQDDSLLRGSIL